MARGDAARLRSPSRSERWPPRRRSRWRAACATALLRRVGQRDAAGAFVDRGPRRRPPRRPRARMSDGAARWRLARPCPAARRTAAGRGPRRGTRRARSTRPLTRLERAAACGRDAGTAPLLPTRWHGCSTPRWAGRRRGHARRIWRGRGPPPRGGSCRLASRTSRSCAGPSTSRPDDPRAPYYLGNLLYDRRRYRRGHRRCGASARGSTRPSRRCTATSASPRCNVLRRPGTRPGRLSPRGVRRPGRRTAPLRARPAAQAAGHAPPARLRALEARLELVAGRDDLTRRARHAAQPRSGRYADAVALLRRAPLPPLGGRRRARRRAVGRGAPGAGARGPARTGDADRAATSLISAMTYPVNLGEGKHLLTPRERAPAAAGGTGAWRGRRGRRGTLVARAGGPTAGRPRRTCPAMRLLLARAGAPSPG